MKENAELTQAVDNKNAELTGTLVKDGTTVLNREYVCFTLSIIYIENSF